MTTSSITAALPGTASSTSRGQSCPSACAIGHIGPDQRDLVLIALTVPARPNDLEDARVFLTIQEGVKAEDLEVVARGLIRSCTLKPISELPRGVLQLCE